MQFDLQALGFLIRTWRKRNGYVRVHLEGSWVGRGKSSPANTLYER